MIIEGELRGGHLGKDTSNMGDINGDGIDDLGLGAFYVTFPGIYKAGRFYVIYGRKLPTTASSQSTNTSSSKTLPHSSGETFKEIETTTIFSTSFTESITTQSLKTHHTNFTPIQSQMTKKIRSSPQDQTTIYAVVATSMAIFAACGIAGGVYLWKRKTKHPDLSLHSTGQSHQQDSQHEYAIISTALKPNSHYKDWPSKPKPHTTDHYFDGSLSQLNVDAEEYQSARVEDPHTNYDDISNL